MHQARAYGVALQVMTQLSSLAPYDYNVRKNFNPTSEIEKSIIRCCLDPSITTTVFAGESLGFVRQPLFPVP